MVRFEDDQNQENVIDNQGRALIAQSRVHSKKISHEEWVRCKEHQQNLRDVLVHEAKRDLYEKLVQKQAEQDKKN